MISPNNKLEVSGVRIKTSLFLPSKPCSFQHSSFFFNFFFLWLWEEPLDRTEVREQLPQQRTEHPLHRAVSPKTHPHSSYWASLFILLFWCPKDSRRKEEKKGRERKESKEQEKGRGEKGRGRETIAHPERNCNWSYHVRQPSSASLTQMEGIEREKSPSMEMTQHLKNRKVWRIFFPGVIPWFLYWKGVLDLGYSQGRKLFIQIKRNCVGVGESRADVSLNPDSILTH